MFPTGPKDLTPMGTKEKDKAKGKRTGLLQKSEKTFGVFGKGNNTRGILVKRKVERKNKSPAQERENTGRTM